MRTKWLGAFVVIITLALSGLAQPLVDRARAQTPQAAQNSPTEPPDRPVGNTQGAQGPQTPGGPQIDINVRNGGAIGAGDPTAPHAGKYGPVDQSAPLNFATQPSGVPRNYVPGQLYNVQALKGLSYGQVVQQMTYYTESLGVSCQYCHNVANFAYDTPTKKIARSMILMSNAVQTNYIAGVHKDYPNYEVKGAVGCATCHRGAPVMPVKYNIVPVRYLEWPAKSSRQAGFVVNSMYSASKSLGVNCLFCHNSADFVTLQYYPTNQIAHRMWRMVDDINHKYLPPNVEAVTCYTCHQGAKWPTALVAGGLDQSPVQAVPVHPEVHGNPGAHTASGVQ